MQRLARPVCTARLSDCLGPESELARSLGRQHVTLLNNSGLCLRLCLGGFRLVN